MQTSDKWGGDALAVVRGLAAADLRYSDQHHERALQRLSIEFPCILGGPHPASSLSKAGAFPPQASPPNFPLHFPLHPFDLAAPLSTPLAGHRRCPLF